MIENRGLKTVGGLSVAVPEAFAWCLAQPALFPAALLGLWPAGIR